MLQNVCFLYGYITNLEVPFSNPSPYRLLDLFVIAPRCTQDALRRFYNWQSTRLSCLFLTVPPTIPRSPFHPPFLCLALSPLLFISCHLPLVPPALLHYSPPLRFRWIAPPYCDFYMRRLMCLVSFASTQDNQKDLEMATETLSEYLERDITSECLSDIKQKVQDKYRYLLLLCVLPSCSS